LDNRRIGCEKASREKCGGPNSVDPEYLRALIFAFRLCGLPGRLEKSREWLNWADLRRHQIARIQRDSEKTQAEYMEK
jgi:hypothetical protein